MPHSCTDTGLDTSPVRMDEDDDDEDEGGSGARGVSVDSGDKKDRLNPPTEYDVLELGNLSASDLKAKLNEMGAEGWALIATTPHFVFRRMKKTEEEKKKGRVGFGFGGR